MVKIFLSLLAGILSLSTPATLKVTVKNIQAGKGNIVVEVFSDNKTLFKKPFLVKTIKASDKSLEVSLELPEGVYAISAYQDINSNQKMDKGFVGMPIEPYGLSNNFRPSLTIPTFDDFKIKVAKETSIAIKLK